jgi:simple sugar transport system ATP-binding protein
MTAAALALEEVSKRFGSAHALVRASLAVRPGTVHALLGENGAGKTTLMRIAYGLIRPDSGVVRIEGRPVRLATPANAIAAGLGMVHQHFTIVHAMTVAENVALGRRGFFDERATARQIESICAATGMQLAPSAIAGSLDVPAQQELEIVKALAQDARILILDEPTAVLAPLEAERLLKQLRRLASTGLTVILITHKLREALSIADEVTVLRRGTTVLAAPSAHLSESALADAILGSTWMTPPDTMALSGTSMTPAGTPSRLGGAQRGAIVLRATNISVVDDNGAQRVRNASLEIHAGEIVGIAGVAGSGVRELLRALAGRMTITGGTIEGPSVTGFIPEDRHREALILDLSLAENMALHGSGSRRGLTPWSRIRNETRDLLETFDIRAQSTEVAAATLSGGNQQKLVLARELASAPSLLIAENPVRGLDLRGAATVFERLRRARDGGMAIIIYSGDLDELLALADRILVLYGGSLSETFLDREAIGQAMLGTGTPLSDAPLI